MRKIVYAEYDYSQGQSTIPCRGHNGEKPLLGDTLKKKRAFYLIRILINKMPFLKYIFFINRRDR